MPQWINGKACTIRMEDPGTDLQVGHTSDLKAGRQNFSVKFTCEYFSFAANAKMSLCYLTGALSSCYLTNLPANFFLYFKEQDFLSTTEVCLQMIRANFFSAGFSQRQMVLIHRKKKVTNEKKTNNPPKTALTPHPPPTKPPTHQTKQNKRSTCSSDPHLSYLQDYLCHLPYITS